MPNKVSIIIPVYNVELYLRECLDSVRKQTFQEIEVICINDKSTDSSLEILQEYAEKDSRIKVIDNPKNLGLSGARNVGMKAASGKYIYFLDSDDYIEDDAIEKAYIAAEEHDAEVVFFDSRMIYEDEKGADATDLYKAKAKYPDTMNGKAFLEAMRENDDIREPVWIQFWNRNFLERIGLTYYEGILHEDLLFTFVSLMEAERVICISEQLHVYRIRGNAITSVKVSERHIAGLIKTYAAILSYLTKKGIEAEGAVKHYLDRISWKVNRYLDVFDECDKVYDNLEGDESSRQVFKMIMESKFWGKCSFFNEQEVREHNRKKISVLVVGDFEKDRLDECIYSIIGQTYDLFEVLVVLKENCGITKKDIAAYDDNRVIGISCSVDASINDMFNIGFSWMCTASEYCVCIDGNDRIGPDYLNAMLREILERDCDILCGGTVISAENTDWILNTPGVTWNRIYKRQIDWDALVIRTTQKSTYFRSANDIEYYTDKKKFDWRYENLKLAVLDSKYEYISFDIFDTLVQRPFYEPVDLFALLDAKFEKAVDCNISFSKLRKAGEAGLRKQYEGTDFEDVSIDEIYENIGKMYHVNEAILIELREYEKELEVEYCSAREAMKDIYQLILDAGKKIIIVSDMYLDKKTVERILEKNGYAQYEKLFLSSEYRKLKWSGHLFDCVLEELAVAPEHIMHIGDNVVTDIDIPHNKGMAVYHIPKALDVFLRPEYQRGMNNCVAMTQKLCGAFIDYEKIEKSLGYRCMLAQVANKYFDNPYRCYVPDTIVNQDSYFMGYYYVGMYLMGLNQWIEKIVTRGEYDTIYFTARDGWLPMLAYNILRSKKPELPKAEYFYTSRQAVLPAMMKSELDFYDLPIDVKRYTPKELFRLLSFACSRSEEEWKAACIERGMEYESIFEDEIMLQKAEELFVQKFYDRRAHQQNLNQVKAYYANISDRGIMFDMGYSGRIQDAVCYLAGKPVDVMYVHSDADRHHILSRRSNFKIYSYYDFIPQMSDVLREYMLSAYEPTCVGYKLEGGKCVPVLEDIVISNVEKEMVMKLHQGAQDFVQEFYDNFGEVLEYVPYKGMEVSLPLEGFMRFNVDRDRAIFWDVAFDDTIYGAESGINLKIILEQALNWLPNYANIEI